jgi:hypothetical protein
MNVSKLRPPPGGFEGRLEAELVKVVTARATVPRRAGPVHIRMAAFTVDSYDDGTIHVTWDKSRSFQDRRGLQQALRAAGLPVLIKDGVFCKGPQDSGYLDASGEGAGVSAVMRG